MPMSQNVQTVKIKRNSFLDTLSIVAGTFLLCLSVEMFLLPYNILSGGVAGISVVLYPLTHIDTTMMANTLTIILLFVGRIFLGRDFFLKTVLSSFLYPVFNFLLQRIVPVPEVSMTLASFYGGLLGGAGVGLVMRTGASTGGMDVPPLVIHRYTDIPVSTLVFLFDGLTVLLGCFIYSLEAVLIGLISVMASSVALNKILTMGSGADARQVQIISEKWDAITNVITRDLNRSSTILDGVGGYTREERKVVMVIVSKTEYYQLIATVKQLDPMAFIITSEVADMQGEGWTYTLI